MLCPGMYFILPSNNEYEILTTIIILNIFHNTRTFVLNMFANLKIIVFNEIFNFIFA